MSGRDDAGQSDQPVRAQATFGLCADIGGSFIKWAGIGTGGLSSEPLRRPTPAQAWPAFCAALRDCCADLEPRLPLSLSIAGTVDPDSGAAFSANVPCVNGRRLAAELGAVLGRPVLAANDADCFVLAEALRGSGMRRRVVFGIVLGTGVGGGLVIDGRIVEGAGGIAGEWGHGPLLGTIRVGATEIAPLPCGCGQRGCLDTLGAARGLERLDALSRGGIRSSLAIVDAWSNGEADAVRSVEAWLDLVAGPLAVMVNVTGAAVVPVAGGLANSRALIEHLDAAVRRRVLRRSPAPLVVPSHLGDQASLLGAALRLDDPARPDPASISRPSPRWAEL